MKNLIRSRAFMLIVLCAALWAASQWWEKALAKPSGAPIISPNGCYRVQVFKPFWVLPGFFHPMSHPDEQEQTHWFVRWEVPAFFRLYDHRNGQLLGESAIYDLVSDGGPIDWGYRDDPNVSAVMINIGPNQPDCIGDEPSPRGR
ncbi:hypothetical protein [Pseudomonas sp. efr-133-TYG-5]|jgi:hypothetical protein|uniref:hypothetical protein n=1 Tax=Pseudomonas sp. efr-133-TYG-5 TaxID=3040310 RepID=UPI002552B321|nr:hypothetical protein [Pseudomonas sp. efr-133-TYG-5]